MKILEGLLSDVVILLLTENTIKKSGPAPSQSKRTTALTSGDKLSCASAVLPWSSRNTSADRSLGNSVAGSWRKSRGEKRRRESEERKKRGDVKRS